MRVFFLSICLLPGLADSLYQAGSFSHAAGATEVYRTRIAVDPQFSYPLSENLEFAELMETTKSCTSLEHRQFDFWIGEWEVRDPAGQIAGTNSITREFDGCLLVEHWQGNVAGTSQNFYHQGDGKWHQNWIDSQANGPLWLVGGLDESGSMVMTDVDPQTDPRNLITWTPNPNGTVRQHWQQSQDGGQSWETVFDGLYLPREKTAATD